MILHFSFHFRFECMSGSDSDLGHLNRRQNNIQFIAVIIYYSMEKYVQPLHFTEEKENNLFSKLRSASN